MSQSAAQARANARYRVAHRDDVNRRARERYAANRAKEADRQRRYNDTHLHIRRASGARARDRYRTAIFDHYGWECACCGAADRLTIDHIDGSGAQHRKELFGGRQIAGTRFYSWLIQRGFPPGYQTLCLPCNRSKGTGPRCRMH